MAVTQQELQSFTQFVAERMDGDSDVSLENCLALWRAEQERTETIAAIRHAEADIAAGRVYSLEQVDAEIRKKYGFRPRNA